MYGQHAGFASTSIVTFLRVQEEAYLIAEADGFADAPETYWDEAECALYWDKVDSDAYEADRAEELAKLAAERAAMEEAAAAALRAKRSAAAKKAAATRAANKVAKALPAAWQATDAEVATAKRALTSKAVKAKRDPSKNPDAVVMH